MGSAFFDVTYFLFSIETLNHNELNECKLLSNSRELDIKNHIVEGSLRQ